MAVSWTKNWSASDDGSVFAGADIQNIQNDIDTAVDLLISAPSSLVQGDTLYYNGSAWARLAPGTAGQYLKTGGSGANPSWASGFEFVTVTAISNDATINFTSLAAGYDYMFALQNVLPITDDATLQFRTNNDNSASTFDEAASDYSDITDAAETSIGISSALGNATGEGMSGLLTIFNPGSTAHTHVSISGINFQNASIGIKNILGGGKRNEAAAVDAVRFIFSSGNLSTGNIHVYRRKLA